MPSPFPGMDPYLESPAYWRDVHHWLISNIAEHLNGSLPRDYVARIDERLYLVEPDRSVYPDVLVRRIAPTPVGVAANRVDRSEESSAPWKISVSPPEEVREAFIEVWQLPERRVVTVIEVLSPSNKTRGAEGEESYRKKQQELREQRIALLELDFLRGGIHAVDVPLEALRRHGHWDYLACLRRSEQAYDWEVWPIHLQEPLPTVLVPLAPPEPDCHLPLQPMLDRAYYQGRYETLIDYRRMPEPPLRDEDAEWARNLLRPCQAE